KAYLGAGREEDAITELKNMINNPQTQVEGDLIRRGPRQLLERIYLQSGRKETLRRFYEETVKEFPDASWYNRAGAFALAEGEFGRAEQYYKQALEKSTGRDGDRAAALDGYLQALLSGAGTPNLPRGSWEPRKLDKVFEEGRKHVDSDLAPAYLRMADAKLKLGDEKAAIQYCQRGLAKAFAGSDEVFASQILQRMYSLLGAEGVLEYCMGRLETEPDSVAANLAMFNLMKMSGDYNEALRYIDRCLELIGPADPRRFGYVIRKVSVLDLAYNRTSDNDYLRRIIAEFESLLTKMPNNTIVLNNLAYVLAKNNERLAEALEYAERACKVQPNNPGFLDTYGYVLYKNGRNERAEEYLQAAVQQYEQSNITVPAEVYEHLGLVKEGLGAKTEALNAYKKALEVGADTLPEVSKKAIESAIERLSQSDSTGMQMPKRFNLE
ncbi:MAG: tetratricopeptide repeat protein, partial [Planctomycetota bacterium]